MKKIKYKLKNDSTIYSYIGTLESFKMTTGYSEILSICESPNYDKKLKKYI